MSREQALWNLVHHIFDTDDGSLPDVIVCTTSPSGVVEMWTYLRRTAAGYASAAPWFWHRTENRNVPVDEVPNAAQIVVVGEAEAFHTVLRSLASNGVIIPDLGVFVFPDEIDLDYRMGKDWNPRNLVAFFELLKQLQEIDHTAVITPSNMYGPEAHDCFARALSLFD